MSKTALAPEITSTGSGSGRWKVVIFNNETNSQEEVVAILIAATQCPFEEAMVEMKEAHMLGKADVHFASKAECERAASIIARIGLQTEVTKEWQE